MKKHTYEYAVITENETLSRHKTAEAARKAARRAMPGWRLRHSGCSAGEGTRAFMEKRPPRFTGR
jgi:hypothetical protein